ncbi:MAG: hypothetical protein V4521_08175 [Pseudomonadota bacterium]
MQALRFERLEAFVAARQVGQETVYPGIVEQAHRINQHPPQPVGLVEQRGHDQQPSGAAPVKGQRIFLALP